MSSTRVASAALRFFNASDLLGTSEPKRCFFFLPRSLLFIAAILSAAVGGKLVEPKCHCKQKGMEQVKTKDYEAKLTQLNAASGSVKLVRSPVRPKKSPPRKKKKTVKLSAQKAIEKEGFG